MSNSNRWEVDDSTVRIRMLVGAHGARIHPHGDRGTDLPGMSHSRSRALVRVDHASSHLLRLRIQIQRGTTSWPRWRRGEGDSRDSEVDIRGMGFRDVLSPHGELVGEGTSGTGGGCGIEVGGKALRGRGVRGSVAREVQNRGSGGHWGGRVQLERVGQGSFVGGEVWLVWCPVDGIAGTGWVPTTEGPGVEVPSVGRGYRLLRRVGRQVRVNLFIVIRSDVGCDAFLESMDPSEVPLAVVDEETGAQEQETQDDTDDCACDLSGFAGSARGREGCCGRGRGREDGGFG